MEKVLCCGKRLVFHRVTTGLILLFSCVLCFCFILDGFSFDNNGADGYDWRTLAAVYSIKQVVRWFINRLVSKMSPIRNSVPFSLGGGTAKLGKPQYVTSNRYYSTVSATVNSTSASTMKRETVR